MRVNMRIQNFINIGSIAWKIQISLVKLHCISISDIQKTNVKKGVKQRYLFCKLPAKDRIEGILTNSPKIRIRRKRRKRLALVARSISSKIVHMLTTRFNRRTGSQITKWKKPSRDHVRIQDSIRPTPKHARNSP